MMQQCIFFSCIIILLGGCFYDPLPKREGVDENTFLIETKKYFNTEIEMRVVHNKSREPLFMSFGAYCNNLPIGIHIQQSVFGIKELYYENGNIVRIKQYDLIGRKIADCFFKSGKPFEGSMWYSYWGGHGLKESRIVFFFNGNEIRSVPYQEEFLRDLLRVIKRYETNNPFKAVSDSRCNSAIIRVIDKEGWQYTWENENLIKAIKDDISFEAQYDTSGRRIRKKIFKKGQLIKYQAFSYDGNNLSAIYDLLNNKRIPMVTFSWREAASSVLYSMEEADKIYYYVINNNNSVIALVDDEGKSVAQYAYGPFGKLLEISGPISENNPFRFGCGFYDEETGLLLIDKKYYDPDTGTWLTK